MQNVWRELRPGPKVPDIVYAIVEIPKGSRNKYEYNKENGVIVLDRVLFSSLHYPGRLRSDPAHVLLTMAIRWTSC